MSEVQAYAAKKESGSLSQIQIERRDTTEDDVAIDIGLDAATATFAQSNPWFGEPEANIGVDTNNWAEFAIEPQLYLTLKKRSRRRGFCRNFWCCNQNIW